MPSQCDSPSPYLPPLSFVAATANITPLPGPIAPLNECAQERFQDRASFGMSRMLLSRSRNTPISTRTEVMVLTGLSLCPPCVTDFILSAKPPLDGHPRMPRSASALSWPFFNGEKPRHSVVDHRLSWPAPVAEQRFSKVSAAKQSAGTA